jgi:tetratricopeptide (TPR) repeat protein
MSAPDDTAVPPPNPVDPSEQLELKLPDESGAWRDLALWAGVLVLLSLVTYWPAVGGSFQWLDDRAVSHDRLLAMPGGLSAVWDVPWHNPHAYRFPVYAPVAFTADWIAYRAGGHNDQGLPTPTAYHITALACHAGAAVLAWLVLRELAVPAAWMVAAVFALHPVNAEAASWISDGGVTVGGLLFFGSAYAYLWYMKFRDRDAADRAGGGPGGDPAQTWGTYAASAVAAILAALAWPAAGAVPGVVLLALWWRRRLTRADTLLLLPVLAVTAILWLAQLSLVRPTPEGGVLPIGDLPAIYMVAAVGHGLLLALAKMLVPVGLNLFYTTTAGVGFAGLVVAAAVLLAVPILWAVRTGQRGPAAAGGIVVLTLVPALNWFDAARHTTSADSAAYLAVVPLAAVVLAAVAGGLRRVRSGEAHTQLVVAVSAVLLVALGATAWTRARAFETPVSLWEDAAHKEPRSQFASAALAEQLRLRGAEDAADEDADATQADLQAAVTESARAAALAAMAHDPAAGAAAERTWAAALVSMGDDKGSLPHFDLATRVDPDAPTLVQYGQALLKMGQTKVAIAKLDAALAADPTSAAAHRVLGQAYKDAGNDGRCLVEEQTAVGLDPSDLAAQQLLAEALTRANRLPEALQHYIVLLTASKENQARGDLWAAIGRIKSRQGEYREAVAYLTQAQQLDEKLPDIDRDLAAAKADLKRAAATRPAMTQPTTAPAAEGPDASPVP